MQIGICLSGGGIRATVFHLGVLLRLARTQLLESVTFLSSVSGGSLSIGLVYSSNELRWPSSKTYQDQTIRTIRTLLTTTDLQKAFTWKSFRKPWTLVRSRAHTFATLLESLWGIQGAINELSEQPRWVINATSHETGKNWRFMAKRMGDYKFGYCLNPSFPICHALAASAAVPIMVGPYVLGTREYSWVEFAQGSTTTTTPKVPAFPTIHLWDGALYDNLGSEALFKVGNDEILRDGIDFLLISDATPTFRSQALRNDIFSVKRSVHDIPASQVASLRSRILLELLNRKKIDGRYLKIGNLHDDILVNSGQYSPTVAQEIYPNAMSPQDVNAAAQLGMTARRLSGFEFDTLLRHGYEVADCTLHAYSPNEFKLLQF